MHVAAHILTPKRPCILYEHIKEVHANRRATASTLSSPTRSRERERENRECRLINHIMMACPSPISPAIFIRLTIFSLLPIVFLPCSVLSSESEDCFPRLLQLAPCTSFVRGFTTSPTTSCCDNLNAIYIEKPACLCALLNGSINYPINQTLALELPHLCNLQPNTSVCPGLLDVPPSSSPSEAQAQHDPKANSSTSVPPSVALPPAVASTSHRSSGTKLKVVQSAGGESVMVLAAAAAGLLLLL